MTSLIYKPCDDFRLPSLLDTLRQSSAEGMLEGVRGGPTSMMQSGISQAREVDDPPGLYDKTEYLLREWVNMYHAPAAGRDSTKAFTAFVQQVVISKDLCISCKCTKSSIKMCMPKMAIVFYIFSPKSCCANVRPVYQFVYNWTHVFSLERFILLTVCFSNKVDKSL